MHRFYLPPDQCQGASFVLSEREAHHGLQVLRLRVGEEVVVLDGLGQECRCQVSEMTKRSVRLAVEERRTIPPRSLHLTLLQGIPKGKVFDSIIQKATELGVYRIVPLLTERSAVHLDEDQSEQKIDKWRLVAIEAIKQCGSPWMPVIEAPVAPKAFLTRQEAFDLELVAALHPDSRHPRELLSAGSVGTRPFSCSIWVGPEGDFAPSELESIRRSGAKPITLGPLVLRCDTAAIYCLSILNYEFSATGRRA